MVIRWENGTGWSEVFREVEVTKNKRVCIISLGKLMDWK